MLACRIIAKTHDRRAFLGQALRAGALALVGSAGCVGPLRREPNVPYLKLRASPPGRVAMGLYRSATPLEVCEQAVSTVTDMGWLAKGDSVFVKVACNSDNPHPAVTYPPAVEGLVQLLRARGAGAIYVGDQAGVEHVRLTQEGRVSSTAATMAANGLSQAVARAGAKLHCFDDHGWGGYYQPAVDFDSHWERSPWVPKILEQVDHVVYLTRLGSHALSGYTCGLKNAVGWLRDDSRLLLHQRGASFFEKIAEINNLEPLRKKLRLTLTLGTHALLNIGPDFGAEHDFGGLFVIAATKLVDHDAVAAALIPWLDGQDTSLFDIYSPYPASSDFWNNGFVEETWGSAALDDYQPLATYHLGRHLAVDACISRLGLLQRYRPAHTDLVIAGDDPLEEMSHYLARYSGRPFRLLPRGG